MQGTEPVQVIEQQRFDCAPFTEPFFLRVRDGSVAGYMQADENYSFRTHIDSSGRFRALMQTDIVYTYEEIQRTRQSAIVLVLEGTLPGRTFRGTGKFVVGDTALDAKGCSTSVQFVAT